MTVYVAHAPADREAAEALEKFLERRGQFVELDDGTTALRPVQQSDVVVLFLSEHFAQAPARLRLEQRAFDAWAEERLIVVKLDKSAAPVGLRDLPAIAATFDESEFKGQDVANAVREMLARPVAAPSDERRQPSPPQAVAPKKRGGVLSALALLLALPGLGAGAATSAIWLVNRIGPTPGTLEDLRRGIDQFGSRYGAPSGVTEWIFLFVMLLTLAILVLSVVRLFTPRARPAKAQPAPPKVHDLEPAQPSAIFVSYARANAKQVLPVIEAVQAQGRTFWTEQKAAAGELVRTAAGVMVMCSKAAFESDQVKREIFLADRYSKKLTPVFIEQADPPEDFEYFFAGAQPVKLFETPEADRPQALASALGATT